MAFRDLVLFLVFETASLPQHQPEDITATEPPQPVKTSTFSLFAQAQVYITYKRCKTALKKSKTQIVFSLGHKKPRLAKYNFDMVSGEDLATLAFSNLQNRAMTDQGDFLLTELYTDFAIKMVRQVGYWLGSH